MAFITSGKKERVLSVFSLAMINVIAVDSLRTLPFSAKFGGALVFYYLLLALIFFLPVAFITAELATTWPKQGGIYVWVREAFGDKYGFLVVWLQWVYNVVWYPTILSLVAGVAAFLIEPELLKNNTFVLTVIVVGFWVATLVNCFGMRLSSWVSTFGSIFGTLLPMIFIAGLGIAWIMLDKPSAIVWQLKSFIPEVSSFSDLSLAITIMFGLMGLEMSAVHAQSVKNPSKDYPRALLISVILILVTLVLSSLAVAIVVPVKDLNIVTGMLQAFKFFFAAFNLGWMLPIVAVVIIIGAIGGVATWIIGPTKGLLAAAQDDNLPAILGYTNKYGSPVVLLILQAIIVTGLSMAYVLLPTVESAYLILTELTAILALIMYVLMFVAAIRLRYSHADIERPYKIPGKNWGIWLLAGCGIVISGFAIILGFIPPSQVEVGNVFWYQILLASGVLVFCLPAIFIHKI